jgi:hypothetical protein
MKSKRERETLRVRTPNVGPSHKEDKDNRYLLRANIGSVRTKCPDSWINFFHITGHWHLFLFFIVWPVISERNYARDAPGICVPSLGAANQRTL